MKRILVIKEKHGDWYMDATDDKLYSSALAILTSRYNEGYWYEIREEKPKELDFSEETIINLPLSFQPQAKLELHRYKQKKSAYDRAVKERERIEHAVKHRDGKEAWSILQHRSNNEYEEVTLERLAEIEIDQVSEPRGD